MYNEWDWEAAEAAFRKAIDLNPSNAEVHAHYTWLHALRGDWEKGFAEAGLAQELDPLSPVFTSWLGELYWGAGRYEDAEREARKALELNPGWARAEGDLGRALLGQGRVEEALQHSVLGARVPFWRPLHGITLVRAGRMEEAGKLLEELLAEPAGALSPPMLASFQALYGDLEGAMASLERGLEVRDGLMPWIGSWFEYGGLVEDPRFQEMLKELKVELVRPGTEG
jgi:serine/threonine-protein kinase